VQQRFDGAKSAEELIRSSRAGAMRGVDLIPSVNVADEERSELELALRPSVMAGPLAAALHRAGLAPSNGGPACHILDVRYEPGERCTILYELGDRLALGTLVWGAARERTGEAGGCVVAPGMRVDFFPADPAMPGLATAMRPEKMVAALGDVLAGCREGEWRGARCRVTALRYRPGRRCTLRLELWTRHAGTGVLGSRTLFGKVYHSTEKARSVFEQMQTLSDVIRPRAGRLVVARVAGFLPDLPMVVQEPLQGVPLDLLLHRTNGPTGVDRRGERGVVMAGAALTVLHGLDLTHPRRRSIGEELQRMAYRSRPAARVDPGLGARMADLAAVLLHCFEPLSREGGKQRIVHADCKPSQFLIDGTKVGLLDFDHAGMADPALDVGTFMASLRQLGCRRSPKARRPTVSNMDRWMCLERSFLDSYCRSTDVDDDFRQRAVWYEAFALLRKAQRAFARSFRSPVAGLLVDEARLCLLSVDARGAS